MSRARDELHWCAMSRWVVPAATVRPAPEDESAVAEALAAADRGELLSAEESEAVLVAMEAPPRKPRRRSRLAPPRDGLLDAILVGLADGFARGFARWSR